MPRHSRLTGTVRGIRLARRCPGSNALFAQPLASGQAPILRLRLVGEFPQDPLAVTRPPSQLCASRVRRFAFFFLRRTGLVVVLGKAVESSHASR